MEDDELDQSPPFKRAFTAGDGQGKATTILESRQTGWTNEKHNMYLNSVEESFVNQLYSKDYHRSDSIGWLLRTRKHPNSSRSNANNLYFGQIKHHTRGYWENLKSETTSTNIESKDESHIFSTNSWIQHFGSSCKGKITESNESQIQDAHSGCQRYEATDRDGVSSSKQLPACFVDVYNQDCTASAIEVSDQNFAEKEQDQRRFNVYYRKNKGWKH